MLIAPPEARDFGQHLLDALMNRNDEVVGTFAHDVVDGEQ
jgi:hypothetical protein